jgi:hypothetical protein
VTVHIRRLFSAFSVKIVMGGENQSSLTHDSGCYVKAQCTGKPPSYLEPNSGSMHVPIEGVYRAAEKLEGRSLLATASTKSMLSALNKGGIDKNRTTVHTPKLLNECCRQYCGYELTSCAQNPIA